MTELRAFDPTLIGSGVPVAMVEAQSGAGRYQVNPATTGLPANLFDYYETTAPYGGAGAAYDAAKSSSHAESVANGYFDLNTGVAPGVSAIENFDAGYFYNGVVSRTVQIDQSLFWAPVEIASPIVNQSFIFSTSDAPTIATVSRFYDAYANAFGTLFVNGLNNSGSPNPNGLTNAPASMFNGISVGRIDGNHSGRPNLVAPGSATSFATPYVSGAAAVLHQAASRGDASALPGTNPADSRVIKSVLLTGATKSESWSNSETSPLDSTSGAGIVDVNRSYTVLAGEQQAATARTSNAVGNTNPASADFTSLTAITDLNGWDLNTLTASLANDAVAHYFFDLTHMVDGEFTFTASLTWNSLANLGNGTNPISNFDLILRDLDGDLVLSRSLSTVQNIEYLFLSGIAPSQYDLQVILRGGASAPTFSDDYALSYNWDFLAITPVPEPAAGIAIVILVVAATARAKARKKSKSCKSCKSCLVCPVRLKHA